MSGKKAPKRTLHAASSAAVETASIVEDQVIMEDQEPAAKKARPLEAHEQEPSHATNGNDNQLVPVVMMQQSRVMNVMKALRKPEEAPRSLVELCLEVKPGPRRTQDDVERIQSIYLGKLAGSWEANPSYFARNKPNPAAYTMSFNPHPDSQIPSHTGVWSMDGPMIRSPLFLGFQRASVTPDKARRDKEKFKKEDEKQNGTSYYLNIPVTEGDNIVAEEQKKYVKFMQDDVTSLMTMMMLKATKVPDFPARGNALRVLLNDKRLKYEGKYNTVAEIPLNDPTFLEHRDQCRSGPTTLVVMNPQLMVESFGKPITFSASADDYTVKPKREWVPIPIYFMYLTAKGSIRRLPVPDEGSVYELFKVCPYGVDHRLKVNLYKGVFKTSLDMKAIYFFPQLNFLMQFKDSIPDGMTLSESDLKLLEGIDEEVAERKKQAVLPAPPQVPAITNGVTGTFNSYSVNEP